MKLQTQDYIGAQSLQQQLLKLNPKDALIKEFSALLPDEVAAQKEAMGDGEDEYYDDEEEDEEEDAKEDAKEDEHEDEPEAEDQPAQQDAEEVKNDNEEAKNGAEEESEYDEEAYGEEDYDEEGRYIWGKEGDEWDWYYKEDKEAHERGDPIHPSVINE